MPDKNRKKPKAQAKPNDATPAAKKASGKKSKQSSELAAAEAALLVKHTSDMLDNEEEQEQEVRVKKKTKTTQQGVFFSANRRLGRATFIGRGHPEFGKEDTAEMDRLLGAEHRIMNATDKSKDTTKFIAEEYTSRYDYHLATLETPKAIPYLVCGLSTESILCNCQLDHLQSPDGHWIRYIHIHLYRACAINAESAILYLLTAAFTVVASHSAGNSFLPILRGLMIGIV
ncbi:hypothetical protein C8R44DRAFT_752857 [Mycena epipterygia]|nr:hypothetical protein C8R44DRAFT_752857 [Mycena epipterygia]